MNPNAGHRIHRHIFLILIMAAVLAAGSFIEAAFAEGGETQEPEPPKPAIINSHKSGLTSISVRWTAVKSADGYQVQRSTRRDFSAGRSSRSVTGTRRAVFRKLAPGKKYYFRVRSFVKTGKNTRKYSTCSKTYSFRTLTYSQRAGQIMKGMTTKEKAGQLIFRESSSKARLRSVRKNQYGGYLLFASDFKGKTPKSVRVRMSKYQKASKVNMLIGVDEEGGTVVRVSKYRAFRKHPFRSPRSLYKSGGYTRIRKDTYSKAKLLLKLRINTNFAPVADVPYSASDYIYPRAFSTKVRGTCKYIRTVVRRMKKSGLVSVLKHFPGYGRNGNTHTLIIRDKRSMRTFKRRDLRPFKTGIANGCDLIMVSHNIVYAFDKKRPASLSRSVHKYLRKTMKFKGVIITDSMSMAGVKEFGKSNGDRAVRAIRAGNDMICTPYAYDSIQAIRKAVRTGKISKKRLNTSVRRILIVKLKRGIIK